MSRQLLIAAIILYISQSLLYITWFVDDAAISFTFARNLGNGEGLVLFPGGERVEGYSNPLWVFLLAPFSAFGLNLFVVAKVISIACGISSLVLVGRIGERLSRRGLAPASREVGGDDPACASQPAFLPFGGIAAVLLAVHPPYVAWTTSGLEGGLFCFLLILAVDRVLYERFERTRGPVPWSGFILSLVAFTRPEGILYFLVVLLVRVTWECFGESERPREVSARLRRLGVWTALFAAPWVIYQFWHFSYFATLITNTFYVKRPELPLADRFLDLKSRGGRYVTNWFKQYQLSWAVPLMVLPFLERRRSLLSRDPGWVLIAGFGLAGVFFTLISDGDWMREFRFMAPVAPFCFLLMVGGMDVVARVLPGWCRAPSVGRLSPLAVLAVFCGTLLASPAVIYALKFYKHPEVSVADVKARSDFFREAREKLGLEGEVIFMDPDLGATSYYSGMHVADTWGLAHVPFAVHRYKQPFVADYVFSDLKPHFAHVFGYWNSRTHILDDPRWGQAFVPLPTYRNLQGGRDGGNYLSIALLRAKRGEFPEGESPLRVFAGGLELVYAAFDVEALPPGGKTRLELYWRKTGERMKDALFLTRLIASSGEEISLDHLPMYGWYQVPKWRRGEVLRESLEVDIPLSQPEGGYRLEVRVLDPRNGAEVALLQPRAAQRAAPSLAIGRDSASRQVAELVQRARVLRKTGRLREAAETAKLALSINPNDSDVARQAENFELDWRKKTLATVEEAFVSSPSRAARIFRSAYWRWRGEADVVATGRRLGGLALRRARNHEETHDLERAFRGYLAAVTLDPRLSIARRRAESLRLRRDSAQLPPAGRSNSGWIRALVVGAGSKGTLSGLRKRFVVGESVICQVFWIPDAKRHKTEWVWFDPDGVEQFKQAQTTASGTRLSFAYINALDIIGEWTVEVRVNGRGVGIGTFQVVRN